MINLRIENGSSRSTKNFTKNYTQTQLQVFYFKQYPFLYADKAYQQEFLLDQIHERLCFFF